MSNPQPDREAILASLAAMFAPEGVVELRAFPKGKKRTDPVTTMAPLERVGFSHHVKRRGGNNELDAHNRGTATIVASASGLSSASAALTVTSSGGAATKLALSPVSATTQSGAAVSYTATIQDVNGNSLTSATNPITFAVSGVSASFNAPSGSNYESTAHFHRKCHCHCISQWSEPRQREPYCHLHGRASHQVVSHSSQRQYPNRHGSELHGD